MRHLVAAAFVFAFGCKQPTEDPQDPCVQDLRPAPLRLLTRFEVDNTLRDLVGETARPAQGLPAEPLAMGLDNNGEFVQVTSAYQSALLDVAEQVASRAIAERKTKLVSCAVEDASCGRAFVESFGKRAFRRPLTAGERDQFVELFDQGLAAEGFNGALEWTLTAFLMSPQFLYRLEPYATDRAVEPLGPHALASRLSYFLWGSMPDEALLEAASTGALESRERFAAEVQRLIDDPRSAAPAAHFFSLWVELDAIGGLEKSAALYPAFDARMRPSWQRSIELYVSDAFRTKPSLPSLLSSRTLFVDDAMGAMYGDGPVAAGAFVKLEMPADSRAGLLTQPGLLARLASPDQSSPIRRGVFTLERVMCEHIAPPPPTVMAAPPPVDPSSTTRERFAEHSKSPGCAGCHLRIDGIGFGFESYDAIGAYRTTDNGRPVNAKGEIVGANESALDGPFDGAVALAQRLALSRQVHDCMSTQWYRYALGRLEADADACNLEGIQPRFFESGGDFNTLRTTIVQSPAFRNHARTLGGAP